MVKLETHDFNAWFGHSHVLKNVSIEVMANEILSVIGTSNSGKTTFRGRSTALTT